MNFGSALSLAMEGHCVARKGWNGKQMWITWTPGSTVPRSAIKPGTALARMAGEDLDRQEFQLLGHFDMRTADNKLLCGWLASQTDMSANDWEVIYPPAKAA